MATFRDALVSGVLAMGFGIVFTLLISLVVPPPLALPVLVSLIAATTFVVGFLGSYTFE
jgi:hypothetical protein